MYRKGFSEYFCVYSRGNTTSGGERFFPTSIVLPTSAIKSVRAMMDVLNITGDLRLKFAFQESDDRESWGSSYALLTGNGTNADGFYADDGYQAVTLLKAWVRFGIVTRNDSAGTPKYEFAWVSTRFDTRSC